MDFDDDSKLYMTSNERGKIYTDYLVPIKAKISQIVLYDPEVAVQFLTRYNDMVRKNEILGLEILSEISALEIDIEEYEREKGKDKLFKEQSRGVVRKIEELKERSEQLDLEDFEQEFLYVKEIYNNNSENYNYSDRDIIEQQLYRLYAILITRKVRQGGLDLNDEIKLEDAKGLEIAINAEIYNITQRKDRNVQDIVDKIQDNMIEGTYSVYNPEIWRLLDLAQGHEQTGEIKREKTPDKPTTESISSLVPAVPKENMRSRIKRFVHEMFQSKIEIGNSIMLLNDTVYIGDKTISVYELSRIDMTRLSAMISEEFLTKVEEKRLEKENRQPKEKFMPDSRTPIYDFFESTGKSISDNSFCFGNVGMESKVTISYGHRFCINDCSCQGEEIPGVYIEDLIKIIKYADFLDEIMQSNLGQQLRNELGTCLQKIISEYKGVCGDKLISKLPIYNHLMISYNKIEPIIEKDRINFRRIENDKRTKFYEKTSFRENLKPEQDSAMNSQNQGKPNETNGNLDMQDESELNK